MEFASNVIEYALNQTVGFFVGALASFWASLRFARWWSKRHYKQFGTLVGSWVEANDTLQDRPFSICNFYFTDSDGKLKTSGDSYDNNGNVFYRWWSVVLYIDDRERRMSYIYETQLVDDTKKDDGFGSYTLKHNMTEKRWDISGGYFQDLDQAEPRFCKMVRFEDVASHLKRQLDPNSESDRRFLIMELLRMKDADHLRTFFGLKSQEHVEGHNG